MQELVIENDGSRYSCRVTPDGDLCIESCATQAEVLEIPGELDGYPVAELGRESFAGLPDVRAIICPPHLRAIGEAAFRDSPRLERIALPPDLPDFEEAWFEGCSSLREIAVPGCTGVVALNSARGVHVEHVRLGAGVHDICVPRVPDAYLTSVSVDAGNPWISSDGVCLYDAAGEVLLKCVCTVRRFDVAPGCRAIAPEAFAYNKDIERIVLPEGVESIGAGAFGSSSVQTVVLPMSLREIGKEAFANCKNLERIELNEGLERIGRHAFRGCSSLRSLHVPSTVSHLDSYAFERCAGANEGAVEVDPANQTYFIDGAGVLYERTEAGVTLLAAIGAVAGDYEVLPGTRKVAAEAFANNAQLESVTLPEGLLSIGKSAFADCKVLERAVLPLTLRYLGDAAFKHTRLESLSLPASLAEIGPGALCVEFERAALPKRRFYRSMRVPSAEVQGTTKDLSRHAGEKTQQGASWRACKMEVDASNGRYCVESDFVCERLEDAERPLRALWYFGDGVDLVISEQVGSIVPYATANAAAARALWLHEGLVVEGRHAVQVLHPLQSIHIVSPSGGDDCVLHPAPSSMGVWSQNHAFDYETLDFGVLAQDCDEMLYRHPRGFERSWRLLDRLAHPRLLTGGLLQRYREDLLQNLDEVIDYFARRNYLVGIRQLVDLGLVDAENIGRAVELACAAKGVAVTAFLLEAQRALGPQDARGFDDFDV